MILYLILFGIISVGMMFVQKKLGALIHGPRDIREEKGLFQRIFIAVFGVLSPVGNPEENLGTIFALGRKDARTEGTATVFRAAAGWRYGYLILMPFLIAFAIHLELGSNVAGQTPVGMYLLIGGLLIWCGVYMWRFRLVIDGIDMSCTTGTLMTKHFDLTELIRAQTTRDGYQLTFEDGRKISIPRFLEGHDLLRDFLIGQLEDNGH
ncbi:hypothetical protein [uncultured Tateyamaria sp.]|uniref:hypothetical protein n=1 Tax=Tateyamaria sp. 1078 TaxID=3417464 RepID=UPI00262F576E|nr:hypothetical protein [uncultured Tateyamaria sp.]